MRQTLAILLTIFLLVPAAHAQNPHDWTQVDKLKLDDPILIKLWNGEKVRGDFISVSDDQMRLGAYDRHTFGAIRLREINRADIRRVELVRRVQHLPNPKNWVIGGAIVGGAAGVGLGIHRDFSEPSACGHACWLVDVAAAAGLGALAGLMAGGLVGIGRLFRRNKLIYEDTTAHISQIH